MQIALLCRCLNKCLYNINTSILSFQRIVFIGRCSGKEKFFCRLWRHIKDVFFIRIINSIKVIYVRRCKPFLSTLEWNDKLNKNSLNPYINPGIRGVRNTSVFRHPLKTFNWVKSNLNKILACYCMSLLFWTFLKIFLDIFEKSFWI